MISDCYLDLGRRATIELLDHMKQIGFHRIDASADCHSQPATLTFRPNKEKVILKGEAEKMVLQAAKTVRPWNHHQPGTLQQGARHLDARS